MRYGIFSDIHSNLEAFTAVILAYQKENIDKYLCVGDIVGYGADPVQCIALFKSLNCVSVAGNHDVASYDLKITDNFNDDARIAAEWTFNKISKIDKGFLRSLKLTYEEKDFILVHGSLVRPEDFCYILDIGDARNNFAFQQKKVCFVGHSHRPGIFKKASEKVMLLNDSKVTLDANSLYLVNVGSVGQPRDSDNRASFCILDTEAKTVEIKRIAYDIQTAADKIIRAGLPEHLAQRLFVGR